MAKKTAQDNTRKISMNLPRDMWKRIRMAAAVREISMTELVTQWLSERMQQEGAAAESATRIA